MNKANFNYKKVNFRRTCAPTVLLLFCFSFLFLFLPGCEKITEVKDGVVSLFNNGKEADLALAVVEDFFDALVNRDYEKAYNHIYIPEDKDSTLEDFTSEFSDVTQIVSIEINWIEVKNNIATAGIDLIDVYDDEQKMYKDIEVSLVKDENNEWKINFWNQK